MRYSLVAIRQECSHSDLNLSDEVKNREIESDFQRLNSLRVKDLRDKDKSAGISTLRGNNDEVRKTFWFGNVSISHDGDTINVKFQDGHTETFECAQVHNKYQTLDPEHYGPKLEGAFKNPNTGTVHLANENGLACGRDREIDSSDIEDIDTESDRYTYNSFCSPCSKAYNSLLMVAADLGIRVN